jgi:DNA-binding NarL/FixJ family response regulator
VSVGRSGTIRIVIADDHALFRDGIRLIFETQSDLAVVGESGDSEGAVQTVTSARPDVLLLDVSMPGSGIVPTVDAIRRTVPGTRVVILTMYDDPRLVQTLLRLGVRGFLLKTASWQELVAVIRGVCADDDRVSLVISHESLTRGTEVTPASPLSVREHDVLELTAQGLSNMQIASRLALTEATVKRHLHNIFVKLKATSRLEAVNKAVAGSLIEPPLVIPRAGGSPVPTRAADARQVPWEPGARKRRPE